MSALKGDSNVFTVPGVLGENTDGGDGVFGIGAGEEGGRGVVGFSRIHTGVEGTSTNGTGVWGSSDNGEAVHGASKSRASAAVVGVLLNDDGVGAGIYGETKGRGPAGFFRSASGEGVHAESRSRLAAAVVGIQSARDASSFPDSDDPVDPKVKVVSAAIYGETYASGPAGVFISHNGEGVHAETHSNTLAAVVGIQKAPDARSHPSNEFKAWGAAIYGETHGHGPAGHFKSTYGGAVLAETLSVDSAAVAAIINNLGSTGAAVYGENPAPYGYAGYFKGVVAATRGFWTLGADCAEDFDVIDVVPDADTNEPGTVVVIGADGLLRRSDKPYDKCVAGVVSGAGDLQPGIRLDRQPSQSNRKPIALAGKVYCKVDASFAPIEAGDLLTTSPTPGHAMKVADEAKAFGTVIGKALRPFESGVGLIPILIGLQ